MQAIYLSSAFVGLRPVAKEPVPNPTSLQPLKMVKIFVGNVASATTEAELRALFEQHGVVSDCDILKNYGFVHMDEEDAAQKAVAALHKQVLNGSRITVEYATTKVRNATKIYVGNVPEGVTASKIKELFQPYGKVVECDIVKNYAFVHMQRENEALEAIRELNHTKLEEQKIFVSLSRSNQAKNSRGDEYFPPPPHHYPPHPHHPPYLPPRPPLGDFYPPRGRLPPPPLPPPPPRAYYDREAYERGVRHDPYAAARIFMTGTPSSGVLRLRSKPPRLPSPLATTESAALWAIVGRCCLRRRHRRRLLATCAAILVVLRAPQFLPRPPPRPLAISVTRSAQALIKMITWRTSTAMASAVATKLALSRKSIRLPFCIRQANKQGHICRN
ncbi:hypothetical protein AMELA_G00206670 [Ameiurus melas]|uniref:RRM domain-containing protein n=1 Tax=Ameiurus melas TaxID=219545 RepID=A0A7J6A7B7_AMEME|nr:hypothetical protein AMELA_G00206670 [Ameiurus melas]